MRGVQEQPGSPLTGRYLVKNPVWTVYLRGCDAILDAVVGRRSTAQLLTGNARRVLLAVGGHIGDAVIATATLSLLKREQPQLEVGIVTASWAGPVFDNHPDVSRLHVVDHWKLDRSRRPLGAKIIRHRQTLATALPEIRSAGYDVAIDFYAYYPNMAWLLWRAGIPIRVGYRSGGYGALYTHAVGWRETADHTAVQHARLVSVVFPTIDASHATRCSLAPVPHEAAQRADVLLQQLGLSHGEYAVVHMGVGSSLREWPKPKWREVVRVLMASGVRVVLTGAGAEQVREADDVARDHGCVNLAGRLRWHEFVYVIAKARVVVAPETVAGHVAAAVGTPCVSLYTGMGNIDHWRPLSDRCSVLTHAVPCAPCYRRRGCATMDCIRGIEADDVIGAVMVGAKDLIAVPRGDA